MCIREPFRRRVGFRAQIKHLKRFTRIFSAFPNPVALLRPRRGICAVLCRRHDKLANLSINDITFKVGETQPLKGLPKSSSCFVCRRPSARPGGHPPQPNDLSIRKIPRCPRCTRSPSGPPEFALPSTNQTPETTARFPIRIHQNPKTPRP